MKALLLLILVSIVPRPQDDAAQAALKKLAERFKDAKSLSAKVVQSRKTALLDKPIVSSGSLFYRREPAKLVFRMTEPRAAEIHLDKVSYQVYRPDEKRLEWFDFENDAAMGRLLMVFQPKPDEIGKAFTVRKGESSKGEIEILLEPSDEKVRARLRRLALLLDEKDGTLKRIAYTDPDGDEVRFELSEVKVNPELDPATFELRVPEGTRVLRHAARLEK
jgi:outer membrane lipoprotein-sorting protein